ncbi:hypothetical protein Lepil_3251 [Leptonema illini DSM 21528]|uniref:Uncharacterized protein n=1 Tax=Leptonema illini DSM 21528 TaxID=929563 RepID=H2CGJ6_9LEPT|nr:hypothetical protein Lepil_3251 [Leptonema illini DSM 21528]
MRFTGYVLVFVHAVLPLFKNRYFIDRFGPKNKAD